jgi:hypothetical protein
MGRFAYDRFAGDSKAKPLHCHLPEKPCEFNRSTQHLLAVYWQGSGTLKFFAVVG